MTVAAGQRACSTLASLLLAVSAGAAEHDHGQHGDAPAAAVASLQGVGRDFEFIDGTGKLRQLSDLRGEVVAVFFGFTSCPDACPGFLAKSSVVSDQLGDDAARFKVVFVTIDPQRDDRRTLVNYVKDFGDMIIPARVPAGQLPGLLGDFAMARQVSQTADGELMIDHNAGAFLFDTAGRPRHYLSATTLPAEYAAMVQALLPSQES